MLAPRVMRLIAADISSIALRRTAERCSAAGVAGNVEFSQFDLAREELPARADLIVCGEVLYYLKSRGVLRQVARRIADALNPGGHVLLAHANLVVDDPAKPGFDWPMPFGAATFAEVFAATNPLRLVREIATPYYRVQLYRKDTRLDRLRRLIARPAPRIDAPQAVDRPDEVAKHFLPGGGKWRATPPEPVVTERLPILMYHRVAPHGAESTRRWRVTPGEFEEQLRFLRDGGYQATTFDAWQAARDAKKPLPGRAVILTFDDGYLDFYEHALPLLTRYAFAAYVYLVADRVGQTSTWDRAPTGEELPLMSWEQARLAQAAGITFGSHAATHPVLTDLNLVDVTREAARSRATLTRELGGPVTAFAYPHGRWDPAIAHLLGGVGFTSAVTCKPGRATFADLMVSLPRIEVRGTVSFERLVIQLGS
jgi:peptidoglycan/xylan/chitin deacetylase (PgdA/CDA1 family)